MLSVECFYPKSWERQRVQKETHAAPGRQVSTWVHAVKTDESAVLGVVLSFCHPLPEFAGIGGV
jgi:hypothetical protein